MLHASGVEDRGAESGGEDDHPEVLFEEMSGGIEIEIGTETGIGTGNEIGIERGKGREGPGVQERHLRKGNIHLGGRCN